MENFITAAASDRIVHHLPPKKPQRIHAAFEINYQDDRLNVPMTGTCSDVRGTVSATVSRNTIMASTTEIPREIFSPASGGRQKTTSTRTDSSAHGTMTFIT